MFDASAWEESLDANTLRVNNENYGGIIAPQRSFLFPLLRNQVALHTESGCNSSLLGINGTVFGADPLTSHAIAALDTKMNTRVDSIDQLTGTTEDQPIVGSLATVELASDNKFNSVYGYGLVNAASAVASAVGKSAFAEVPNFGGANWANDMVKAPEVWAEGITGEGIIVAVIDSGMDIYHADLNGNVWKNSEEIAGDSVDNDQNGYIDDIYGWNFGEGQNNNDVLPGTLDPGQSHGTHVAGIIAAKNDGSGSTGVAPDAKIMAIRVGDVETSADGSYFKNSGNLVSAIQYAVDNGADIINLSLGWKTSPELEAVLAYAASNNVIVVSAAGNDGLYSPSAPASYATQYGISVGAVDQTNSIANFSNYAGYDSSMQHVVAPGVNIYSTLPNGGYGDKSGTSMAAPHVAGVVALMLSANPSLTHAQVRSIITASATELNNMSDWGNSRPIFLKSFGIVT